MALLRAEHLRKSFAQRTVVDDVSFHVDGARGDGGKAEMAGKAGMGGMGGMGGAEIVGLLGRNGAGKTTSFRMVIGMVDVDDGRILFDVGGRELDVTHLPMYQRARLGMGYLSQEPSIFTRMTVEQNLLAILETLPMSREDRRRRADELLAQFGLTHKARQPARTCSGGERRKLEIARSLITSPRLILLDEPFSGVDPIAVEDLQTEIRRLAASGIACLITDHNVQQTLRVCSRAYIIDSGRVFAEGTPRELIKNDMVRRVYLGSLFRGDEFDDLPDARPGDPHASPASPRTHPPQNGDARGEVHLHLSSAAREHIDSRRAP